MANVTGHRLLGLSCGAPRGSAEILLNAALDGAEEASVAVEIVRVGDLDLVLAGTADAAWVWDKLLACDGLIVSTPIMSRAIAAPLKTLIDRVLGPHADAAFVEHLLKQEAAGVPSAVPFRPDIRVLKPRVAGLIAVGGSLTPQWKALALPLLHSVTFSMHMAVADQALFGGAGTPRSIVLEPEAIERCRLLGRNVASQIGRPFAEVAFHGEAGLCPLCHLDAIVLHGTDVECATCGARGELADNAVRWIDLTTSVLTMDEKRAHVGEVEETALAQNARRAEIEALADPFARDHRIVTRA